MESNIHYLFVGLVVLLSSCSVSEKGDAFVNQASEPELPGILVLGIAQDAGYPQIGCFKECCSAVYRGEAESRNVTSLAIVDSERNYVLVDASPDLREQIALVHAELGEKASLKGIYLTHAHIGHYLGLAQLGREAMGSSSIPVYAAPRMKNFLEENGPWEQLVDLKNIEIMAIEPIDSLYVLPGLSIQCFPVPHRDEYSETLGYKIHYGDKKALYIPDIDKWNLWEESIAEIASGVDHAFVDATFYSEGELPGRDMSLIPHPLVMETIDYLRKEEFSAFSNLKFIHLNHTNPLLWNDSIRSSLQETTGAQIAKEGAWY